MRHPKLIEDSLVGELRLLRMMKMNHGITNMNRTSIIGEEVNIEESRDPQKGETII